MTSDDHPDYRQRAAGSHPTSSRGGGSSARSKLLSPDELLRRRAAAKQEGKIVVQCHGCFDIVHPGHIRHLRQAKSHGDILLVTITGDGAWTKRDGAPLIPQEHRAENLAELDCVDWVAIEPRPTAAELLCEVRPDVYVKGKEYERSNDPRFIEERRVVESHGGRVVFSSGDVVFSSSALISSMEQLADPYHARLTKLLARPELDGVALNRHVTNFRDKRVLVVGETILDTYWICDQPEVASESPVLTLRPIDRRQYDGGAAVIARHLAAMGARPVLLTALPHRTESESVRRRLASEGVEVESIPMDTGLPEKQRFLVGSQKVMKVNNYQPIVMDAERQDRMVDMARSVAQGFDAAIIVDFGNGMLSPLVIEQLGDALRSRVGVLAGDVSGRRAALRHFRGFDLLTPSEAEAREAMQCYDESLPVVALRLFETTAARSAFITMGADGLLAFSQRENTFEPSPLHVSRVLAEHVPSMVGHALDPMGCGDALLAAATLCLAAGAPPIAAAMLGSLAAAREAHRLGNIPISATDLRHAIARTHTAQLVFAPEASEVASPRRVVAS
jgi:rfaE bifunctional protein kinase chain/domain/rfaE bifunctional protein nucleotidyltransferase chain/domain